MNINLIEVLDDDRSENTTLNQTLDALESAKQANHVSIKVVGVGGGGCNAVNNIYGSGLKGVHYVAVNTDNQSLNNNQAEVKIQLGNDGQGAGAIPAVAEKYAQEKYEEFESLFSNTNMVFITAGLGKGTGTGATGIIAKAAKAAGALTVGVVTKPFAYEGAINKRLADQTAEALSQEFDALITIMNSKLEEIYPDALMDEWYKSADEVLINAVGTIVEVIHTAGYQNVDFKDVVNVMGSNRGRAMMGTGRASGDNRAKLAVYQAMNSQLLEESSLASARGILVNITAARSKFRGKETSEIMKIITDNCSHEVNPLMGLTFREDMGDDLQVTLIVSGLGNREKVVAISNENLQQSVVATPNLDFMVSTGTHDAVGYSKVTGYQAPVQNIPTTQTFGNHIPTLTQAVEVEHMSNLARQRDLLEMETLNNAYIESPKMEKRPSQAEQMAAELASFQHKIPPRIEQRVEQRSEPNLLLKPNFGHFNRPDSSSSVKGVADLSSTNLDVPTFLRKPIAD